MKHTNIKVLAIAPYQGLLLLLEKEVSKYPQIKMDIVIGNLEEGVEKALSTSYKDYDVIISRGGTAELLRETVDIPVIEVPLSFYDILRAIQMSANLGTNRAVVGFESITRNVKIINDLLDLNLDIYTLVDAKDSKSIMESLSTKNYDAVLCDVVSFKTAIEYGLNPILFASGEESVNDAFKEAFQITQFTSNMQNEINFLKDIMKEYSEETIVFSEDGNLYYSSFSNTELQKMLKDNLENVKNNLSNKIIKTINNQTYHIVAKQKSLLNKTYIVYYINPVKSQGLNKLSGISSYSYQEAKDYIVDNSLYTIWTNFQKAQIEKLSLETKPVVIVGDYGSGKLTAGISLYLSSENKKHPLFIIDGSLLTDKSKEFLLNSHRSPLFYTDNTLLFINLESCDPSFLKELLSELKQLNVSSTNKIIFTFACDSFELIETIKNRFLAYQLNMPSLKDYPDRIPSIINSYLSQINAKHAIEILRLSKNAMDIASHYSWKGNIVQLQQVISQAALNSTDHIIHSFNLQTILSKEDFEDSYGNQTNNSINIHKTLYEIEKDIINLVLKENNGNQTAAAKQLGIGRTTLWRIYQNKE